MTTLPTSEDAIAGDAGGSDGGGLTPGDLGELMSAFNEVTTKLEASHETLRAEVSRLNGELAEANQRLDRSRRLAELGEMAAGIAHELRNPLASIGLYARMLEEDLPSQTPTGDNAGKIACAVRRMDAIVTDVLAFARE
ncbi:MAG: histidine kinase dimerization/phospho-acceptor domain-containing protein, partial [Planctomycetota bacterium]